MFVSSAVNSLAIIEIFIRRPWLAYVVAGCFILMGSVALYRRHVFQYILAYATGTLWILYGMYEQFIQETTPGANIRLDLMFIEPIMGIATLVAVVLLLFSSR